MGRALGVFFGAGCALTLPAVLLNRTPGSRNGVAVALLSAGLAGAIVLLLRSRRPGLSRGSPHVALVVALGCVTAIVWCSNGGTTAAAAIELFAWPPLFAFAFCPPRTAFPYLLGSSAVSVGLSVLTVHRTLLACSMGAMGTAAIAALTAGYLRSLLLRISATDSLTGLPNRQALTRLLERERSRAERLGTTLTVGMIDLDHFKEVNDTGGHRAGDELLQRVASHWRRQLRLQDDLIRYGGDEFVVVLPGCDIESGAEVADLLRRSGGQPCSIGIAQWVLDEPADATLAKADTALYQAKQQGRDRVVKAVSDRELGPVHELSVPPFRRWRPALRIPSVLMGQPGPDVQAMILGTLYIAAGAITGPGVLLFPIPHTPVFISRAIVAGAVVIGVALLVAARRRGQRLPLWIVHVATACAVLAVWGGCMQAHGQIIGIVFLGTMAWAAMYVTVFFPGRVAIGYLGFEVIAVLLDVLITVKSNPVGVALLELGTIMGAAAVIGYLANSLQRQAHVDALTSLPNRRALDPILNSEIAQATSSGRPLSVAIIDLDHFKVLNDTSGHLAGDETLRAFADRWRSQLRPTDSLIRHGGDEFAMLLPGCNLVEATRLLERLRHSDAHSCSVGLAQWEPSDTAESLMARADRALYRAKTQGRNQVASLSAS